MICEEEGHVASPPPFLNLLRGYKDGRVYRAENIYDGTDGGSA